MARVASAGHARFQATGGGQPVHGGPAARRALEARRVVEAENRRAVVATLKRRIDRGTYDVEPRLDLVLDDLVGRILDVRG